jgi:hypothetical protein
MTPMARQGTCDGLWGSRKRTFVPTGDLDLDDLRGGWKGPPAMDGTRWNFFLRLWRD